MLDMAFMSLLIHRCDIQQARVQEGDDDSYGHPTQEYVRPAMVKQGVRCRIAPLSTDEMVRLGISSATIGTYGMYLSSGSLPTSLSMIRGAATHQVVNVRNAAGIMVDPGPFDITGLINPSMLDHHLKIMLSRVSAGA